MSNEQQEPAEIVARILVLIHERGSRGYGNGALTRPDEKLDGDGARQRARALYRALVIISDTDPAQFWPAMPMQVRAEAHTVLDDVIEKLLGLSAAEQLARIFRAAPGRQP